MTHRLILLRHAKADGDRDVPDVRKPLAARGRRQAAQVGPSLVAAGVAPDLVLCSTALRTRQTWELVAASLADAVSPDGAAVAPEVRYLDELYGAGADQVLAAVSDADESAGTVLVVGHEPAMSRTATALAGLGSDDATYVRVQLGVPTAAWSVLTVIGPWAELARGGALLESLHVPA